MISIVIALSALSVFSFWRHKKLLEKSKIYTHSERVISGRFLKII